MIPPPCSRHHPVVAPFGQQTTLTSAGNIRASCFGGILCSESISLTSDLLRATNRFGFHNGSSIDSLLDKGDVSVEAILDEDDLLQECKAQNTRLIDYFGRESVLQTLLGYVTGEVESEEKGRFK